MCGTHRFQLFDLSSQRVFNRIRSGTTRSCAPYLIWEHMYGSPKNIGTSRARSLAKRIVRYAPNLCEKPRDRLYGLLSLVSEHDMDHGIEIDYKSRSPSCITMLSPSCTETITAIWTSTNRIGAVSHDTRFFAAEKREQGSRIHRCRRASRVEHENATTSVQRTPLDGGR
jgi:hypothetical protein